MPGRFQKATASGELAYYICHNLVASGPTSSDTLATGVTGAIDYAAAQGLAIATPTQVLETIALI